MLLTGMREWFKPGATDPPSPITQLATAALAPTVARPGAVWPPDRIELAGRLWGSGYILPGGETEILRLAKPLLLSEATSLLLLGCGPGGAAHSIANHLGAWVTGFEADPDLAVAAAVSSLESGLGRRAAIEPWDPAAPRFPHRSFHNALALDPIGGKVEPVLGALALSLRSGGQIALVQTVAGTRFDPADPAIRAWSRLERRGPALPSEAMITRVLGRLGFEVCITEDISRRHIGLSVRGWRDALRGMQDKPSSASAALLVREAELWLHRVKLLRSGALRLIRWHAIHRLPG
jgi:cyclopropane fatty-acyl-phospholipid synthase-like methyltransferase